VSEIERTMLARARNVHETNKKNQSFVRDWWDRLDKFGQFTETVSKVAAYRLSKRKIRS